MKSLRHILLIAIVLLVTSFVAYKVGRVWSAPAERPRVSHPTQFLHTPQQGGKVWLQERRQLQLKRLPASTAAQPLSLTNADVDEDGMQDLVVGNSERGENSLSIYRGNLDAFAPQSQASFEAIGRGEFPSPFLPEATTYDLPIQPDFVVAGRFNADDHPDIAVASRKADSLYVLFGDGKGKFSDPQEVKLPGHVTSITTGQLSDSALDDLALGIGGGSFSLVTYRGSDQGPVETGSFPLPGAASNLNFASFGDPNGDLAFLSNGEVMVLRSSSMKLETISLPVHAVAMALGSFMFDRSGSTQIALLGDDGSVQIAAPSEFDPRTYTMEEFGAIRRAKVEHQPLPLFVPKMGFPSHGWQIVENMPNVVSTTAGAAPVFMRTRVSESGSDDIMTIDRAAHEMRVLSHAIAGPGAPTFMPAQLAATPYDGSPIATLSMRINIDGRPGFIALHKGDSAPSMMMPIPDPTFFVNKTTDPVPTAPITNACNNVSNVDLSSSCSLREAVLRANALAGADTIQLAAGTYTLTRGRIASPVYDAVTGTLNINDSVNIVGTVDGGGNPTSIITWGTLTSGNSVDMVMAVNEDISILSNATASISNVIIENGVNHGTHGNDGDGGCMEYDTGTSGNANLTLTNVILQNCSTLQGGGAGLVTFNFLNHNNNGFATITNSTIQNNSAVDNPSSGPGGGIALSNDARMVMTNSKVLNNNATQVISGQKGQGGGIMAFFPNGNFTGNPETIIHSSTISGNKAAGFGGGMQTQARLLIDQGTIISNNVAGTDGTNPVAAQDGGGLYLNNFAPASCPAGLTCDATLTHVVITGNSASGNGGGISTGNASAFPAAGPLTMTFSRLAGNSATGVGSNLKNSGTTVSATNDWWGTDAAATTINTSGSGVTTFDPFVVLTHSATPSKIRINQSTTLTGDMSKDNHGTAVGLANLAQIIGLPITFDNPVLGTIPQAQPEVINASAQATATFNAGPTSGRGSANATVDQGVVGANSNLIASATEAGTTVTITTVGVHNFTTNDTVVISGVGVAGYNGTFTILSTPTSTTFTYSTTAGLGASSGGTAKVGIIILEPPQITKSFGAATIPINGTTTVSFSINNPNVVAINGSFTDTLPTGLQVASTPGVTNTCGGSVTATAGTGSISFSNSLTPIGTCSITVNVTGTVDNSYTNSVQILSTDAGNGNTSSANITVINPPHIIKAFGASSIPLNGTTSLTFTIDSNGNQNLTLTPVAFTDSLPAGLINGTPSNVSTTCSGGTPTATNGGSTVSLAGASVAPTSSCTVSVTVKGSTAGTKSNSVQVTSTNAGTGNTGTANLDVIAPPTIAKSFLHTATIVGSPTGATESTSTVTITTTAAHGFKIGQTVVIAGVGVAGYNGTFAIASTPTPTTFTYTNAVTGLAASGGGTATVGNSIPLSLTDTLTFTITNPNTIVGGDLTGVAFSDTLPAATGTLLVAAVPNVSNTCNGAVTAAAGTSVISLSGGSVLHNASCTINVDVQGTAAGDAANTTGTITSTEGGTGTTSNTATIKVVAPPTISKAFGAASIPLNGTTTLSFSITNPANNTSAEHGIAFNDLLTNGLQVASTPGVSNTCGGTVTAVANTTSISLSNGTVVTPGNTCTLTVNVTGTQAGPVSNTTNAISSIEGGTGSPSNTANLLVVAPATIAKAFGAATIPLNGTTSLTLTITNPNTVTLNGLSFTDTFPAGLVVATPNNLNNACGGTVTATAGSNLVSLSGGSVGASTQCVISVDVTGTTAGIKANTSGAVSSTEGGTGSGSNTANITVVGPPTLGKSFGAASIPLNGTTSVSFAIANPNTASALSGVAFSDSLPSGLVVASVPNITSSCGGTVTAGGGSGSISLSGGTLTASPGVGSTCNISVDVTGTTAGTKSNTTGAISSTEGGTGTTSNTATLTVEAPPYIQKSFAACVTPPLNMTQWWPGDNNTNDIVGANNGTAQNGATFAAGEVAQAFSLNGSNQYVDVGSVTVPATFTIDAWINTANNSLEQTIFAKTGDTLSTEDYFFSVDPTGKLHGFVQSAGGVTEYFSNAVVITPSVLQHVTMTYDGNAGADQKIQFYVNGVNVPAAHTGASDAGGVPQDAGASAKIGAGGSTGTIAPLTGLIDEVEIFSRVLSQPEVLSIFNAGTNGKCKTNPSAGVSGTVALTFTITNPAANPDPQSGVGFSDTLPTGLVVATPNGLVNNCGGSATATTGGTSISLTGGSLAANTSCTLVVNITPNTPGQYTNTTGSVSSTNGGTGNTASANLSVATPPTIAKVFGVSSIPLNGTTSLTFTINNPAANVTLTGIGFTDNLPAGLVVATPNNLSSTCGGTATATAGSGSVSLSGVTLATNTGCTLSVDVTGTTAGIKNNSTQVTSTEAGNGNTTNASLTVGAPPTISKAFGAASIPLNGTTSVSFAIANPNTASALSGLAFSDSLPSGLVVASTPNITNSCGGTVTAAGGSGSISLSGGTLTASPGAGSTCNISVDVTGNSPGTKSNTTGPITSTEGGTGTTSNTATLTVVAPPTISKAFGAGNVPVSSTTTLTFTITNPAANTSAENGIAFSDTLTNGLQVASTPGVTNTCSGTVTATANSTSISLTGGTIATPGTSCTISVNVTPTQAGTVTNTTGAVSSTNGGTGATSNTATLHTAVPPTITKGFAVASIARDSTTTLTFNITNPNGSAALTGVAFTDNLPAGLVVAPTPNLSNTCGGSATGAAGASSVILTGGTLAGGASCTVQVDVQGTTGGVKNNSVLITSNEGGDGNTSTASLTVVGINIAANDAKIAEPATGTATMLFTVTLSAPAPATGGTINYATADGTTNPATGGGGCGGSVDYVSTSGTLTFNPGDMIKTVPVTICADGDAGSAAPGETLFLNLSSASAGTISRPQATGTITHTNLPGTLMISEVRTSGPAGAGDDFVELYNNQDVPLTITASDASGGYGLFKMGVDCGATPGATPVLIAQITDNTVIPARGHYLLVGSAYSLTGYAAGDQTLTSDIENDRNIGLFDTSNVSNVATANRFDAVGFGTNTNANGGTPNGVCDLLREGNNLPAASGSTLEYTFFRSECDFNGTVCTSANGYPKDTNDNSADFLFADTQATATPMGQRLGAPGPQNKTSGIQRNSTLIVPLLDSTIPQPGVPNRFFDPTATGPNAVHGTLYLRRRVQNNTGGDVTALRFRIIEITTAPAVPSFTDLRALTSADVSVSNIHDTTTCIDRTSGTASNCTVTVKGTTLEQPPTQTMGGGYNSTQRVDLSGLPGSHLAAGQSVEFQLAFGTMQAGRFHVYVNVEDDVVTGAGKAPASLGSFAEDVVVKANQTISFNAPANATYGDGDFSIAATASSGLPVTFAGSGHCAVSSAGLVHLTGAGSCAVTASQAGDSQTNPASDVVQTLTIGRAPTGTAISSSQNSVKLAETVTFTAKVSQAANIEIPTGTVQFKDNGVDLGAPITLNGSAVATLTTSALTAGTHTITADYSGNTNLTASSGALAANQVVSNRPLVNFNAANYTVKQSDGFASIVVNRTGDLSVPVTVDYATADSGVANCANLGNVASARCNFGAMYGTFRFAAGETQKTLDIPITQNAYGHGPQTLTVNLSNVTGTDATLVTPSAANVTITDSSSPTPNAIDDTTIFVRQQYHDFLNREPDSAGLAFWKDNIDSCNAPGGSAGYANAAQCVEVKRVITSAAFFLSIEFRGTGGLVRDFYVAALDRPATNNMPDIVEFTRDTQAVQAGVVVNQGDWQKTLAANRDAFMSDFVMRSEFVGLYPTGDTAAQYVDKLYQHANVTPATAQERLDAIGEFGNATTAIDPGARGRALLRITQSASFQGRELNRGFVQMQYFGYLRRNPTDAPDSNANGFNFWVTKLNQFNGDFLAAEMVKAFLSSQEYRQRFGTP